MSDYAFIDPFYYSQVKTELLFVLNSLTHVKQYKTFMKRLIKIHDFDYCTYLLMDKQVKNCECNGDKDLFVFGNIMF